MQCWFDGCDAAWCVSPQATANATTSTASEREQHTFQWLDQTTNALSESREAHVVAVAETKKVTQQLHQAEAKIGRAAAVLQKLLPVSEHTSGSGLSEMPIVEMSMQVVSAVEDAQKHAQVSQKQPDVMYSESTTHDCLYFAL